MTTTAVRPSDTTLASEPQVSYILDLLDERELFASPEFASKVAAMNEREFFAYIEKLKIQVPLVSRTRASSLIQSLRALPKLGQWKDRPEDVGASATQIDHRDVPAGRYAVTGEDGTTDFYRVDRPAKGRWAGYVFVKLQLSDDYKSVPFKNVQTIVDKIAKAGPEQASKRYGRELGHCGVCGRTLTNPGSIERGIGPVCAGKVGWTF